MVGFGHWKFLIRGKAVHANGCVMENRSLLLVRQAFLGSHALEHVPEGPVAAGVLVHWEVALKHAAVRPEAVEGVGQPRVRQLCKLLTADGRVALLKPEPVLGHEDASQLAHHVGAGVGQVGQLGSPGVLNRRARDDGAHEAPKMVENDRHSGEPAGQRGQLRELPRHVRRIGIVPDVEYQAMLLQHPEATLEIIVKGPIAAEAPEVAAPHHPLDGGARQGIAQIYLPLDPPAYLRTRSRPWAVQVRRLAGRRHALGKLNLADRPQFGGPGRFLVALRLAVDRAHDIMAVVHVLQNLRNLVNDRAVLAGVAAPVP
mmetsp:Transcript_60581/g.108055  ORF Transcript_60581/g.108055 Transcript_60581/m.108055 type:complete len:315 (-) Transcript_60581:155-1099(-)